MLNYPTRGLPGERGLDGPPLGAVFSIASMLDWSGGQKQTSKNKFFFFLIFSKAGENVAVRNARGVNDSVVQKVARHKDSLCERETALASGRSFQSSFLCLWSHRMNGIQQQLSCSSSRA